MYSDQPLLPRLDDRAINLRPEQRAGLAGQVVADHDHVDQIAHLVEEQAEPVEPEFADAVQQGLAKLGLGQEVHEPAFQAAEIPAGFVDHARDAADDRIGRFVPEHEHRGAALEAARIVALGERIFGNVGNRRVGQRMVGDVH